MSPGDTLTGILHQPWIIQQYADLGRIVVASRIALTLENTQAERFLRWLITPTRLEKYPADLRRARLLLVLLLVILLVSTSMVLLRTASQIDFEMSVGVIFAVFIIYVIGRFISYPVSRLCILLFFLLYPLILLWTTPEYFSVPIAVAMLLAGVLLGNLFYQFPGTGLVALAGLLVLLMTLVMYGNEGNFFNWVDTLVIYGVMAAFIWVISWMSEQDNHQLLMQTAALRASEERFQRLLEASPEMIAVQSEGRFRYMNQTGLQLLGATNASEVLGQEARRFYIEPDNKMLSQVRQSDPKKPIIVNFPRVFRRLDGTPVHTEVTATAITYDGQLATLLVAREVERRVTTPAAPPPAVSALYETELPVWLLQTVLAHTQDAVVITDAELLNGPHILFANPMFCRLTGYNQEELIGSTAKTMQPVLHELRQMIDSGQPFGLSAERRRRDGQGYTVEWRVFPVYGAGSSIAYYTVVMRDITELKKLHQELQEREERYQIITQHMSDYAYAIDILPDETSRVVWLTGAFSTLTGYTQEELRSMTSWEEMIYPDDLGIARTFFRGLIRGQTRTTEFRIKKKGEPYYCWVRNSAYPVFSDDQQRVMRIYGTAHDITERIQAEETLKMHVVQQAVIAELGLLAIREVSIKRIIEHSTLLCEQVLEADLCEILIYDVGKDQFMAAGTLETGHKPVNNAQVRYAFAHQESIIVEDMARETRFEPSAYLTEMSLKAGISVMIPGQTQPSGVISIYHRQPTRYRDEDVYFLQAIGNVLATFLERHQARQAEREQREFAAALQEITLLLNSKLNPDSVLNTILEFVAQLIPGHEASTIMLLDENVARMRFASSRGYADIQNELVNLNFALDEIPMIQHIVTTKQTLIINNTLDSALWVMPDNAAWIRSYLGAPIMVEDRCLGVINVDSSRLNAFSEADAKRLLTFASKAAIALRNARYAAELEHRVLERTKELEKQQARTQAILDASGEGIIAVRDNHIIFANRAIAAMTGYAQSELLNQNIALLHPSDLTDEETAIVNSITPSMLRGEIWRNHLRLRRKDGSSMDAGITISPLSSSHDSGLQMVLILRDISAEKALEAQTERFIADAAHELCSPIAVLNTRTYLMRRRPEIMPEHLLVLEKVVTRMNRLVSDLLDMSRFKQGQIILQRQVVVLQNVLSEVLLLLQSEADERHILLEYEAPTMPLQVVADPHRLHQVFTNLINNALNYTPEGGQVSVVSVLDVNTHEVVVTVQDTGQGIPAEQLPYIFQPFFRGQTRQPGTGLGLSITRELVQMHKGTIEVTSVVGEGTCFTVRLKAVNGD